MKLYATVTSERDSRPAKKGGDTFIDIQLAEGNKLKYQVLFKGGKLQVVKLKGVGGDIVYND